MSDEFQGGALAGMSYGTGQNANEQHLSEIP